MYKYEANPHNQELPPYINIAAAAARTTNNPLPTTFSAPLTTTGLLVGAGVAPFGAAVTGPLGVAPLPVELGANEGAKLPVKLPVASSSSSLPVGWATAPGAVVDVSRVLATGQTVTPTETSDVVSWAGQLVVTDGGHEVTV